MFVTNNEEDAALMRRWKFHGIGMDAFDRQNRGRSPQAEVIEPGFKYNLTDICAAIGVSQLSRLVNINTRRRELAMLYRRELANVPEIRPLADPDYDFKHAWHLFVVRVDTPKIDRNSFMTELKARNIGTGCISVAPTCRNITVKSWGSGPACCRLPNTTATGSVRCRFSRT